MNWEITFSINMKAVAEAQDVENQTVYKYVVV